MNTSWKIPAWGTISGLDSLSSATPLANLKEVIQEGSIESFDFPNNILHLFIGNVGGSLGVSGFALLLGALWLLYRKIIGIKISLSYLLTFFILCWIFNGTGELFTSTAFFIPTFQLLTGGLILGAFFMANDTVTSPITSTGKIIFGIGCGFLTFIFRKYSNLSEGVCFSILIMNLFVPILEKYTKPRIFKKAN
jgi:electron transport complex protein RnfD